MVEKLETLVFRFRGLILAVFAAFTLYSGFYAFQLKMTAGFEKQLPAGHEYIQTFQEYRDRLFGSNRIIVVLKMREGQIWNRDFFSTYKDLTDKGEIWIIEIKSGLADFQADDKWPDYLPYCDRFYFAVAPDFPTNVLPENSGLIFADSYGAEIMRDNKQEKLAAARRNLLLRRMARIGGFRWARLMEKSRKN